VRAFVVALVADFTIADDVMQETFLEITRQAASFEMGSNFMAWARAIARFRVLSALRDRQRLSRRLADDVIDALAADAPLDESDGRHEAEIVQLRTCLELLAPAAREMVRLRYAGEQVPQAIAQLRAQSVNAVNVTLARARVALRECIERGLRAGGARP
jgi:RNA polymerase sigma-70 factor (ECF subfamily)